MSIHITWRIVRYTRMVKAIHKSRSNTHDDWECSTQHVTHLTRGAPWITAIPSRTAFPLFSLSLFTDHISSLACFAAAVKAGKWGEEMQSFPDVLTTTKMRQAHRNSCYQTTTWKPLSLPLTPTPSRLQLEYNQCLYPPWYIKMTHKLHVHVHVRGTYFPRNFCRRWWKTLITSRIRRQSSSILAAKNILAIAIG